MKKVSYIIAAATIAVLGSCQESGETDSVEEKDNAFESIASTFISNTLAPTYTALADYSCELANAIGSFRQSPTQAGLDSVCDLFLKARAEWEKSEAFLFGPASDFGIDPHIDSWPLDEDAFMRLMADKAILGSLDSEEGDVYAGNQLGNTLLGFHGIEYIIFKDGAPKDFNRISELEMVYIQAVAGDLRNHTWQLEVSWIGNDAAEEHVERVEELELNCTVNGSDATYADNLLGAGKAGSTFRSWTGAIQYIIQGCIDIADEVGSSKIGKPFSGQDITYIESPYSYRSIEDFYNNIISIKNVYLGGVEGKRNQSASLHAWVAKENRELDSKVTAAIDNALTQIGTGQDDAGQGMVFPFVLNCKDKSVEEAINACTGLVSALEELIDAVAE